MRPLYDELDEFDDFDFADSMAVSKIFRNQAREERRAASRRHLGPHDESDFEDYSDYEDYEDYSDYNDDEFDSYSGLDLEH